MKKIAIVVLLASIAAHAQLWSGILDSSRAIDWSQSGVVGGIPSTTWANCVTSQCNTVYGGTVTAASIQAAINSAPSNTIVRIPAGTFTMSTYLIMASNVALRGAGADQTTLTFTTGAYGGGCFLGGATVCFTLDGSTYNNSSNSAPGQSNAANWTAGFSQGATSITVGSVGSTGIVNGQYIYLDQANDTSIGTNNLFICDLTSPACTIEGGSPGRTISGVNHSQLQIVKVTAGCAVKCTGTGPFTLTITPGLYGTNWSSGKSPGAWFPTTALTNAGIENLTIDNETGMTDNGETINFMNAFNCWASGIRSLKGGRAHVWMVDAAHITVQNSYFYQTQDAASQSYGVEEDLSTDNLVVNNIMQQVTSPFISGAQFGDAFAYNYMINDYQTQSANCMYPNEINHDTAEYNLWEGNFSENVEADVVHGTSGLNTMFRNFFTGYELGKSCATIAVVFDAYNWFENVVGNIMGTPGNTTTYTASSNTGNGSIYDLGLAHGGIGPDSEVGTSALRWANYDNVTGAVRFCGNSSDTGWSTTCSSTSEVPTGIPHYANAVPSYGDTVAGQSPMTASFIYSSQPSWWPSGKAWPPIGPDVSNGNIGILSGGNACALWNYSGSGWITSQPCTYMMATAASQGGTGASLTAHVNGGHAYSIPAMDCYFTMGGPPDGSGSVLTFNASTCYTSSSPSSASLSPSSFGFGSQTINTTSSGQVATLTNTGGSTLNIASIGFTGTNPGDFSKTTTCGSTLGASASCTITVSFTPTATGARSANLVVTDDSGGVGGSTQTTTLTGTGVGSGWMLVQSVNNTSLPSAGGTCLASSLTCTIDASRGMVAVTPGNVVAVTLSQQGSSIAGCGTPATITGVSGGGGGASYVIPAASTCGNAVSGAHAANIAYLLSALQADTSVTITRSGYTSCNYGVSFREFAPPTGTTPSLDNIGCQATGTSSTTYPGVSLALTGTNDAILQAFSGGAGILSITSPYNSDLTVADHDGSATSLNTSSGAAPTITTTVAGTAEAAAVAFTPSASRAATPVCTPSTGIYSQSQSVSCTDSTPASWICTTIDGSTPVSDGVSNCVGTATKYTGPIIFNLTTTLNAIGAAVGYADSLLSNNVYTINAPYAQVLPSSLSFASQATGTSSPIQNVTITNVGSFPLSISNITTSGDYSETDSCSRVQGLPTNASCTVAVTFTPTTSGTRTGTLTITDNSTGNNGTTQTVSLSGLGATPPNAGMTLKGNQSLKGNISLYGFNSGPAPTGPPLVYPSRTDAAVFGGTCNTVTPCPGELLPAACNGVAACLQNAYNPGAAPGHQGAAMTFLGGQTNDVPSSMKPGTVASDTNINGLNSYLNGINTHMTDADFGTSIVRATDASLYGSVGCLGGGNFGISFHGVGAGTALVWSVADNTQSNAYKIRINNSGGGASVLAFNPTTMTVTPSDLCGGYFPGSASFSGTDPHIIYTLNGKSLENSIPFTGSITGTFITPETVTQDTTNATAQILAVNSNFVQLGPATGSPNGTSTWRAASPPSGSGAHFTPNNATPGSSSTTPYATTIYQGIICDGSTGSSEESVCQTNPVGGSCSANDTNPACWYVYWSLVANLSYVASMAGDPHFPAASGNGLPAGFKSSYTGVFAPSYDGTTFTQVIGDNGQNNNTGYNGGGNASSDNGYYCQFSPDQTCQGPVYATMWRVGSGIRVFNSMTDTLTGDWGPGSPGPTQVVDQQAYVITGTVHGTLTPGDTFIQVGTAASTTLICQEDSSNHCAPANTIQLFTGLIYPSTATANSFGNWQDCGNNYPTTSCSGTNYFAPSAVPVNAPFLYPDVLHDMAQSPNKQLATFSGVQTNPMAVNGATAVSYNSSTHLTTVTWSNNTVYSPGQQFSFSNLLGADDQYLNCTSPNNCPVLTAVVIPNTGNAVCPGNGPYCPSGANGTITVSDPYAQALGKSTYADSETQSGCGKNCPTMYPNPQDESLLNGGFGGTNFWQVETLLVSADLRATGHKAAGSSHIYQGKYYVAFDQFHPWLPATVPDPASSNPACSDPVNGYGSPCGLTYPGPLTPAPNSSNVKLIPFSITDDQHGDMECGYGSNDLCPPILSTALVCGQAGSGVGGAACPSQYSSLWDDEIIAAQNAATQSSPGNLVGAGCVYDSTATPVGCIYRLMHSVSSGSHYSLTVQNAEGSASSDGLYYIWPSDWNLTLGCMDGTTTKCLSSWEATAPAASGTNVTWTNDGSGNITINMLNQFCPKNGTQYWYVAKPTPPAGNIQSISCGPTAGTVKLTGFSEGWLNNQTLTLDVNTANNWGCDSTTVNAGTCTAFVLHNVAGATAGPGTETGTQKATPTACGYGVPCQRADVFIGKLQSSHQ